MPVERRWALGPIVDDRAPSQGGRTVGAAGTASMSEDSSAPRADPPDADPTIDTHRLEAFSDGVMAVIITIMALELKVPVTADLGGLADRIPSLLVYVLSFTVIGIYWNNHHHLLRATVRISSSVMWTNLNLLFWLSLIPFATEWVGTTHTRSLPAATYGVVALGAALACWAVAVHSSPLPKPITTDDGTFTSTVSEIDWTDGSIPVGQFGEFNVLAQGLPTGTSLLTFKAVQLYSDGTVVSWIQVPTRAAPDPEHPAPTLVLTAPGKGAVAQASTTTPTATAGATTGACRAPTTDWS
jgi:uncharacterized protein YcnI